MEKLLLLLLIFRVLRRAFPYVVGVLAALLVLVFVRMPMPGYLAVGLFLAVAIGVVSGIKSHYAPRSHNRPEHYRGRTNRTGRRNPRR